LILQVLTIIRPETLLRWHRAGFRRRRQWKSRSLEGALKSGGKGHTFEWCRVRQQH
jgi:hypothetical protein